MPESDLCKKLVLYTKAEQNRSLEPRVDQSWHKAFKGSQFNDFEISKVLKIVMNCLNRCTNWQIVVTRAEQKVFHLVQFAPYDLSQYHFHSFTSRAGIYRGRLVCRIVIVWQNSYSFTKQLARVVNRFEQTSFAFAGCQHQPANHVCPFDPVVLMAYGRACCADGTTHRAKIRWDSHETNTFAEKGRNWVHAIFTIFRAFLILFTQTQNH